MNTFDLMDGLSVIYEAGQQWKMDHKLADILLLVICVVIAGYEAGKKLKTSAIAGNVSHEHSISV